ncbi:MAG: DUF4097 family beta strand repeat protein, partial [Clostridia bacterium]|nr:DUF4097 family beta strand repeat protein [Clostridia bacterium]
MKKTAVITAVVFILVGAALFAGALAAADFDLSKLGETEYETKTYTPDGSFDSIFIETEETDISIEPSPDGSPGVVCAERKGLNYDVAVEKGKLLIKSSDNSNWLDRLNPFSGSLKITLYLPEKAYGALSVKCGTGDITVSAPLSFGTAEIKTSTGDMTLQGVHADELSLSTSTGNINVINTECAKDLSVSVTTGDAAVCGAVCENLISNGATGDITLIDVLATDSFKIERNTGDVFFEKCDAGQISVKTTTGDVTGTLISEKIFKANTSTGDIVLPEKRSGGECEITTSTGDIVIGLSGK